jgi:F-type H+-transporting ATPase subunit delta
MSEAVTTRYARALFEVAKERSRIDEIEEDLQSVVEAFSDDKIRRVLMNPRLDTQEKKALIDSFAHEVTSEVANFLKVLIDRHREDELAEIAEEYTAISDEARGIVEATVTTAVRMSEAERRLIKEQLGKSLNKEVRIEERVDRDVLGGVLVRVGNRVYDGTVAGKLSRFKQHLMSSQLGR